MTVEELSKLVESKRGPLVLNRGIGPVGLLGIAFVIMKITGAITWSWWWVLAPFWIPVCIGIVLLCVAGVLIWKICKQDDIDVSINKETVIKDTPEESVEKVTKKKVTRKKKSNTVKDGEGTKGKNVEGSK